MKVYNEVSDNRMEESLANLLRGIRKARHFDVELYVTTKAKLLNDYLSKSGLSSCVIAVSGGIDSSIVLGITSCASKLEGSPIKKIVPLMLPVFGTTATTNQDIATARALELMECLGLEGHIIDLSKIHPLLKAEVDSKVGIHGDDWAAGQLVAYLRTPSIYYTTSLMSQNGTPGVVVGTTNRDEGAYLGYVGKASDGMVDIQLISDIHKSEVYSVARHLNLPKSILNAIPTGDMYDGRVDEEVFGASYDFAELYLSYLCMSEKAKKQAYASLNEEGKKQFDFYSTHLENLHSYNRHKYVVGSPAIHLDIYESDVPKGWNIHHDMKLNSLIDFSKINGYFQVQEVAIDKIIEADPQPESLLEEIHGVKETSNLYRVKNLFTEEQCNVIISMLDENNWISVGFDGYKNSALERISNKGSQRQTAHDQALAEYVWSKLREVLPAIKNINEQELSDADGCSVWRALGISPLFRFIKYTKGDLLIPHYDAPYRYDDKTTTLVSLVIYLTSHNDEGGETRFIKDPQIELLSEERNYDDWNRIANEDEVIYKNVCHKGEALLMDHRILHDSSEFTGAEYKLIIRTDVVYTKCIKY